MIITVDVHETRHTCPASHQTHWIEEQIAAAEGDGPHQTPVPVQVWHSHWIDRQTTIVAAQDDGPCRNPVLVRIGEHQAHIACRRIRRADQQCVACRTLLIVRHVTHTDLGHQAPQPSEATT